MVTFQISDMTCGHCASAIARAIASVDKGARVDVRLQQKLVRVDSAASAADLVEAMQDAGYTAREVRGGPAEAAAPRATGGCGCGCGTGTTAPVDAGQQAAAAGSSCCS